MDKLMDFLQTRTVNGPSSDLTQRIRSIDENRWFSMVLANWIFGSIFGHISFLNSHPIRKIYRVTKLRAISYADLELHISECVLMECAIFRCLGTLSSSKVYWKCCPFNKEIRGEITSSLRKGTLDWYLIMSHFRWDYFCSYNLNSFVSRAHFFQVRRSQ